LIPIITINVEHMRQSIHHAFTERQLELSSELQIALDRECSPEKIQQYVDEAARGAVEAAVKDAVRKWWLTSEEGCKLISEAITRRMNEEAELYKGRK
jgi:hypothetical protein